MAAVFPITAPGGAGSDDVAPDADGSLAGIGATNADDSAWENWPGVANSLPSPVDPPRRVRPPPGLGDGPPLGDAAAPALLVPLPLPFVEPRFNDGLPLPAMGVGGNGIIWAAVGYSNAAPGAGCGGGVVPGGRIGATPGCTLILGAEVGVDGKTLVDSPFVFASSS